MHQNLFGEQLQLNPEMMELEKWAQKKLTCWWHSWQGWQRECQGWYSAGTVYSVLLAFLKVPSLKGKLARP